MFDALLHVQLLTLLGIGLASIVVYKIISDVVDVKRHTQAQKMLRRKMSIVLHISGHDRDAAIFQAIESFIAIPNTEVIALVKSHGLQQKKLRAYQRKNRGTNLRIIDRSQTSNYQKFVKRYTRGSFVVLTDVGMQLSNKDLQAAVRVGVGISYDAVHFKAVREPRKLREALTCLSKLMGDRFSGKKMILKPVKSDDYTLNTLYHRSVFTQPKARGIRAGQLHIVRGRVNVKKSQEATKQRFSSSRVAYIFTVFMIAYIAYAGLVLRAQEMLVLLECLGIALLVFGISFIFGIKEMRLTQKINLSLLMPCMPLWNVGMSVKNAAVAVWYKNLELRASAVSTK